MGHPNITIGFEGGRPETRSPWLGTQESQSGQWCWEVVTVDATVEHVPCDPIAGSLGGCWRCEFFIEKKCMCMTAQEEEALRLSVDAGQKVWHRRYGWGVERPWLPGGSYGGWGTAMGIPNAPDALLPSNDWRDWDPLPHRPKNQFTFYMATKVCGPPCPKPNILYHGGCDCEDSARLYFKINQDTEEVLLSSPDRFDRDADPANPFRRAILDASFRGIAGNATAMIEAILNAEVRIHLNCKYGASNPATAVLTTMSGGGN